MPARITEGLRVAVHKHVGTDLDSKVRSAVGEARSLKTTLARTEASLQATVEAKTREIAQLRELVAAAESKAEELLQKKQKDEPGTQVLGLRPQGKPPEMSVEDWHALRREGKHLEYLRKVY